MTEPSSSELNELARKAVRARDRRKNEDIEAWAKRLAEDLVAAGESEYE